MGKDEVQTLSDQLQLKQKELDLLMAIDGIRDASSEPERMLKAITDVLVDRFQAELCILFLVDRQTGMIQPQATSLAEIQGQVTAEQARHIAERLGQRACALDTIATWQGNEVLGTPLAEGLHLAAAPIILGESERLGALLLARLEDPFRPEELELLATAEELIDSAVIQGYIYQRQRTTESMIRLRHKELKLIEAIDQVRDSIAESVSMLSSITTLLLDQFGAELCAIFLLDRETGDSELKSMASRMDQGATFGSSLTPEVVEHASRLDDVAVWEEQGRPEPSTEGYTGSPLHYVAVPIIMGRSERLGTLLLSRSNKAFGPDELQLLKTVENHVDSAVVQGHARERHRNSVKELETIYRLDTIRDRDLPFSDMLDAVLQEVLTTIEAEMGFVMLYDRSGKQLEVRAASPSNLFEMSLYFDVVDKVVAESLDRGQLISRNDLGQGLHSLMCLPLILNEQVIGVLGTINRRGATHFSAADRRLLHAIGSQVDTAIFEQREKRQLRRVLGRSVDPRVMERLLSNPNMDILKGERLELSVLYADIRGSTQLAEHTDPELLVGFINDYLGEMTTLILTYQGTLDKFVGDEVMALFGAPFPQGDHALRAVRVGLDMQAKHREVMARWKERGIEDAPIGIGIATGELIVGEMGCAQRTDYTVIGRAANLGSRICSVAKGGEVLVSQRTYDLIQGMVDVEPIHNQSFKGVDRPITVYRVNGVRD